MTIFDMIDALQTFSDQERKLKFIYVTKTDRKELTLEHFQYKDGLVEVQFT